MLNPQLNIGSTPLKSNHTAVFPLYSLDHKSIEQLDWNKNVTGIHLGTKLVLLPGRVGGGALLRGPTPSSQER